MAAIPARALSYLRGPEAKQMLAAWKRQILSPVLIWVFLPAMVGILFVYWAQASPQRQLWVAKTPHETTAIVLLSIASGLFLMRAWLFRLELDYLLLVMAINFMCREIHFAGTDNGVVAVAVCVLMMALYWLDRIFAALKKAPLVRLALAGTFLTYLLAQLIQRRVFRAGRIPLLPEEALLHVPLEEVTENIAHLYFIFIALAGFKQLNRRSE